MVEIMKLYHGTTTRHLDSILKHGIRPRGRRKSMWMCESRNDLVYLTNAYALHFAKNATRKKDEHLVLEVDTQLLDESMLLPDEDAMEQGNRVTQDLRAGNTMEERTAWFRDRLEMWQHLWTASINALGNCAYFGTVPVDAIARIVIVPPSHAVTGLSDPVISIQNYMIMGDYYQALTQWLFDGEDEVLAREAMKRMQPFIPQWDKLKTLYPNFHQLPTLSWSGIKRVKRRPSNLVAEKSTQDVTCERDSV